MNAPVHVKICGLRDAAAARAAIDAGADYLGFVVECPASPRHLSADETAALLHEIEPLPTGVRTVGVFKDLDQDALDRIRTRCRFDILQFHGGETPALCRRYRDAGYTVWKAVAVRGAESLTECARFAGSVDSLLLDAYDPERGGGTGETFDWALVEKAKAYGLPVILAGGLTPDNVATAIRRTAPAGVDVSSGVESSPGVKDPGRIRAFVQQAKSTVY
jgi:phosphoribosylanthranilate isomerase